MGVLQGGGGGGSVGGTDGGVVTGHEQMILRSRPSSVLPKVTQMCGSRYRGLCECRRHCPSFVTRVKSGTSGSEWLCIVNLATVVVSECEHLGTT